MRHYTIKISGEGTKSQIKASLNSVLVSFETSNDDDFETGTTWEDGTLITEICETN